MITKTDRKAERARRHLRVRRKISGTSECPRLCVYRSNKNLFVQIVDDTKGITLAQASNASLEFLIIGKGKISTVSHNLSLRNDAIS